MGGEREGGEQAELPYNRIRGEDGRGVCPTSQPTGVRRNGGGMCGGGGRRGGGGGGGG